MPWSWKNRAVRLPTLWATIGPVLGTLYLLPIEGKAEWATERFVEEKKPMVRLDSNFKSSSPLPAHYIYWAIPAYLEAAHDYTKRQKVRHIVIASAYRACVHDQEHHSHVRTPREGLLGKPLCIYWKIILKWILREICRSETCEWILGRVYWRAGVLSVCCVNDWHSSAQSLWRSWQSPKH